MSDIDPAVASDDARAKRLFSVDIVRGFVIILMALDHAREFIGNATVRVYGAVDAPTSVLFSRVITHLCAPTFVLLAGAGVGLAMQRGRTRAQTCKFLVTRGLWLMLLEVSVVQFGWQFALGILPGRLLGVIWCIGLCMMIFAGVIWLPRKVLWALSLGLITAHNLLDPFDAQLTEQFGGLWKILHVEGESAIFGLPIYVAYPSLPWIGFFGLGYLLADLYRRPEKLRRRILSAAGGGALGLFVLLRGTQAYGEAVPWVGGVFTLHSIVQFFDLSKYPPSLQYLLVTVGFALILLAGAEHPENGRIQRFLLVFGGAPLFFYVVHVYVTNVAGTLIGVCQGFELSDYSGFISKRPEGRGLGLGIVLLAWVLVLAGLYRPTRWFRDLKRRSKHAIWSDL